MARSSRYHVRPRRRREGKTDYKARMALVLSGKPRLVVRGTLKNVTAQIVVARLRGDEVLAAAHSRELAREYGWLAPRGNVPAAYLTGLLCGLKARAKGVEEAILDVGLRSPSKGSRIFAVLNGILDAGIDVPYDEEKMDKDRIKGVHIAKYAENLGSGSEDYRSRFSRYLEHELVPENLVDHFVKVKADVVAAFESGGEKSV